MKRLLSSSVAGFVTFGALIVTLPAYAQSSLPLCPAQPAYYQYMFAAGNQAVQNGNGHSYTNGPVNCAATYASGAWGTGWELHDRECLLTDAAGTCFSDICLLRRPTTKKFEYQMTAMGSAGQTSCLNQNPGGYTLVSRYCLWRDGSALGSYYNCNTDFCLWERETTNEPATDIRTGHAGTGVRSNVDCRNFEPSNATLSQSNENTVIDIAQSTVTRACVIGNYAINDGYSCVSDLCFWQEHEQCQAAPQCRDGVDNDGDGATDFPNDFSCANADDNDETNVKSQCQDGVDNDSDNLTDFPQDPGCSSKQDNDEFNAPVAQCSDGIDNADPEDTLADFNDIGCYTNGIYNPNDTDETNVASTPQCRDGVDNDNDGATDFPNDFSCSNADDNDETNVKAACQDGVDSDNDGLMDYPQDPGCASKQDNDEGNVVVTLPKCSDGIDNDSDGRTDFFDAGCYPNNVFNPVAYNPNDNDETNAAVLCRWARVSNQWVRQCQ